MRLKKSEPPRTILEPRLPDWSSRPLTQHLVPVLNLIAKPRTGQSNKALRHQWSTHCHESAERRWSSKHLHVKVRYLGIYAPASLAELRVQMYTGRHAMRRVVMAASSRDSYTHWKSQVQARDLNLSYRRGLSMGGGTFSKGQVVN